jgi:putative ABC transport system permease protein
MKRSLRSWLWSVPLEQEVDDELAFHREMRARERLAAAVDPRVRDTLIAISRKREREMRLTQWIDDFRRDVALALRQWRRAPGFTIVATLTLAIGIGANSAMFALVDAAFLRPLPFGAPQDRLFMIWDRAANGVRTKATPLDYLDWHDQSRSFAAMAATTTGNGIVTLGDDPTPLSVQSVSVKFFDVLGVRPIAGRTFVAGDNPVRSTVVISEALWRRRLTADPGIVGQPVRLSGRPVTVVGVVPAAFQFAPPAGDGSSGPATDFWILFETPRAGPPYLRSSHFYWVVGRLREGVSQEAARDDLGAIARRQAERFPLTHRGRRIEMEPLRQTLIGREVRTTSALLLGVVGFVLLMCCANVASLVLARSGARAGELAIRSALGAGRRRIVAQLLTEGLVLAALGGLAGTALGAAILRGAPGFTPPGLLPNAVTLAFDIRIVTFCAVSAVVVAVAFGLAPTWQATAASLLASLTPATRITRGSRLSGVLVAAQIAVTVLVLCGAGLLLRTLLTLDAEDPGYSGDALTMVVSLPFPNQSVPLPARGPYGTEDGVRRFQERVRDVVSRIPGVRRVAWGGAVPLDGYWASVPFEVRGDPPRDLQDRELASYHMVSPEYFDTLGIPLVAGRTFTNADTRDARPVCVVTDAFVRRFLKGKQPLGLQIVVSPMALAAAEPASREIVGVVRQVTSSPGETEPVPHLYVPNAQNAWWTATLVVQPAGVPPETLTEDVRKAVASVDGQIRPTRVRTMNAIAYAATARPRFRATLVAAFALLALVLASVGIFGVLTQTLQQKTRELAVRLALGAKSADIVRAVASRTARVVLAGTAIGVALAAMFTRWLTTLLYGVSPFDPLTFVVVLGILTLTALVAGAAPAWRALRIEPAVAFRQE